MDKDMVLTAGTMGSKDAANVISYIKNKVCAPVGLLRRYYSSVLGKEVTMRQTWLAIEAQVAFLAAALPENINLCMRLLLLAWFVMALKRCRKSGM